MERIDFALEPGVVVVAVLFFVLVNVLLAAVLYPYFRSQSSSEETGTDASVMHGTGMQEPVVEPSLMQDEESLEERVNEFLQEMQQERGR